MLKQSTNNIMLVWPASFGFNAETAQNNAFQDKSAEQTDTLTKARKEFDQFNVLLRRNGVKTIVIKDEESPAMPDAVFPNNWVSFHPNGHVVLYPIFAKNRRKEKRQQILDQINETFAITKITDLSHHETKAHFLEGTGSMIFDHINRKAYACISPRTDQVLFEKTCNQLDYEPISFQSEDESGQAIYHTNVMMALGTGYVVICLESLPNQDDREKLLTHFLNSGLETIEISHEQMNEFAGNMLEVLGTNDEELIICSQRAYDCLSPTQIARLSQYGRLVAAAVPTIESVGGGSVRCMMAEIFLPIK